MKKYNLYWLIIAIFVIIIDQISKYLIMQHMALHESITILPIFNLYFSYNPGAAFSLLANQPGWQQWFFILLSLFISIALIIWLLRLPKKGQRLFKASLMLILGGAVGNLIDRLWMGVVRDFLDVHWGIYHWPTFNIADSAICIGAFLMAWCLLREKDNENS